MDEQRYADSITTIEDLKQIVVRFSEERDWGKYHTPKNLASSAAIEAGELMECFQWLTPEESYQVKDDPAKKQAAAEEICDVVSYLLNLCVKLDVDLASEFVKKSKKNALKYPKPETSSDNR